MPAYSYKERFVPLVIDGSKSQTIRARRKKGYAKKGDQLYHYFGLRTKHCKKLRQDLCTDVKTILIGENNNQLIILLYDRRFSDHEFEIKEDGTISTHTRQYPKVVVGKDADRFAWRDGFRPDGSTQKNPAGAANLMHRWWKQTHGIPFIGDVIYWNNAQKL